MYAKYYKYMLKTLYKYAYMYIYIIWCYVVNSIKHDNIYMMVLVRLGNPRTLSSISFVLYSLF